MNREIRAGVLTVSDKGSSGQRSDESGDVAETMLQGQGYTFVKRGIVSDDRLEISSTLKDWVDREGLNLILTSGGTGLSPRDVTPEATEDVIDYKVPGMAEAMRASSLEKTPYSMLSRAVAGVRNARAVRQGMSTGFHPPGACLIINLPGSPRGTRENLQVILPVLDHALSKLLGDTSDCARSFY